MEYLEFLRLRGSNNSSSHDSLRSNVAARARLKQDLVPEPRKLTITASPISRHPTAVARNVPVVKSGMLATSNRRINGDYFRSVERPSKPLHRPLKQLSDGSEHLAWQASPQLMPPPLVGSLLSVINLSPTRLTWWRIVVWGLSNDFISIDDSIAGVVAEAREFHNIRSQHAMQHSEDDLLLTRWWDMLEWASGQKLLASATTANKTFVHVVDTCWTTLKSVLARLVADREATEALQPKLQAAAALSPHKMTNACIERDSTEPQKSASHDLHSRPLQTRHSATMSPSDIAGLAREFSAFEAERHITISDRRSPRRTLFHNSSKVGRKIAGCNLAPGHRDIVEKAPKNMPPRDLIRLRLEVCHNICTCCETFVHQWRRAVEATPSESPMYFATMLQAINDIYEILNKLEQQ